MQPIKAETQTKSESGVPMIHDPQPTTPNLEFDDPRIRSLGESGVEPLLDLQEMVRTAQHEVLQYRFLQAPGLDGVQRPHGICGHRANDLQIRSKKKSIPCSVEKGCGP